MLVRKLETRKRRGSSKVEAIFEFRVSTLGVDMLNDVTAILASTQEKLKREIASMSLPEMKKRPAANKLFASYAVDVGVYNVGAKGQILASTTTAWARADEGTSSFDGIKYAGSYEAARPS